MKLNIALIVAVAAIPMCADASQLVDLKVMQFNIRYSDAPDTGTNGWNNATNPRRDMVVSTMLSAQADIIGTQEGKVAQINYLKQNLPGYSFYGVGRDNGVEAGEYSGIFFNEDRFDLVRSGSFWLSATPDVPGTTFAVQAGATARVASWVELHDTRSNKNIFVLDTHYDNRESDARIKSSALIRSQLKVLAGNLPTIVTADLNVTETDAAATGLIGLADSTGPYFIDSYRRVDSVNNNDELTFHNYNGGSSGNRIDFILNTAQFQAVDSTIIRSTFNGRYASDHYAVTSTFRTTVKEGNPPESVVPEPSLGALAAASLLLIGRRR